MTTGLLLTPVRRCAVFGTTRINQDKRSAATPMLKDDEWVKWSNDEIAKHCAVSQRLVIAVLTDEAKNCSKGTLGTSLFVPVRDTAPWDPSRSECQTRTYAVKSGCQEIDVAAPWPPAPESAPLAAHTGSIIPSSAPRAP